MAAKPLQASFIFLSQIINLPVIDMNNRTIGKIHDIIADVRGMYPRINALIINKGFTKKLQYYPWKEVENILEDRFIVIVNSESHDTPPTLAEN